MGTSGNWCSLRAVLACLASRAWPALGIANSTVSKDVGLGVQRQIQFLLAARLLEPNLTFVREISAAASRSWDCRWRLFCKSSVVQITYIPKRPTSAQPITKPDS